MAITGIRREEACKLWKTDIRWDLGEIVLRPGITKSGREEFCTITKPVQIILEETLAYKKSEEHGEYYRLIPWLFGTAHTKLNKEKLFDKAYRNSDQTRLKTDVKCWKAIREELGWELCTSKMLRKSYGRGSQHQLQGRSDKSIRLMRQSSTEVFDKAYDGAEKEEIKKDAHKVAELFDFIKKKTG
jgi:integrase